jgi:hypothetical protein
MTPKDPEAISFSSLIFSAFNSGSFPTDFFGATACSPILI